MRPGPATHWLWVRGVFAWGSVTNTTSRALASWLCPLRGRHEGTQGGRLLTGCAASGLRPSLKPDRSSLRRAAGARYELAVDAGGVGVATRHQPNSALLRAGFARCGGSSRGPGGWRLLPGCEASGLGRSPTPDCPSLGRAAKDRYPMASLAGSCPWGPVTNPTARALAGWLCLLWGRHEGTRGDGAAPSGVVCSPTPDRPLLGRAAGALTGCGCGGCGRGDPSPTPQHALLLASFAPCEGGMRAPGGGAPFAWVLGVRRWALSHALPPVLGACGRGPLPTGCGRGVRVWVPGFPWHLLPCRGSSCIMWASRVRGTRWSLLLGTCPCALAVAGGVPLWRASWPRVGALRLVQSGFLAAPVGFPVDVVPFPCLRGRDLLGDCGGHAEAECQPGENRT